MVTVQTETAEKEFSITVAFLYCLSLITTIGNSLYPLTRRNINDKFDIVNLLVSQSGVPGGQIFRN